MRWTRENDFDRFVDQNARLHNVPAPLIKAVIGVESAFDPRAFNPTDQERGLMQMIPATARAMGVSNYEQLYDPATSIYFGTKLLAQNYRQARQNWDVAISAYNAGFSRNRPWDAKRTSGGQIVNQAYVNRVKDAWRYFDRTTAPVVVGEKPRAKPIATPKPAGLVDTGAVPLLVAALIAGALLFLRR